MSIPETQFPRRCKGSKAQRQTHCRPARLLASCGTSGRRRGARVQVRDSCIAAPVSSSWVFCESDLTFHANSPGCAPPRPTLALFFFFFSLQEARTLIFQPSPSGGRERKHTSYFHKEGRRGRGRGEKWKEVKKEPNCIPPPAPHLGAPSPGSDGGGGRETLSL